LVTHNIAWRGLFSRYRSKTVLAGLAHLFGSKKVSKTAELTLRSANASAKSKRFFQISNTTLKKSNFAGQFATHYI
jgi:hypothetical protein